jgi:hypothetical protein
LINTDCIKCPFADKCYVKDKFQRLPTSKGGLGMCPKVEIGWAQETCKACHFTGRVGDRGGSKIRNYRTCLLLPNEPIVQKIKGHKKNCPFMEQVKKEHETTYEEGETK